MSGLIELLWSNRSWKGKAGVIVGAFVLLSLLASPFTADPAEDTDAAASDTTIEEAPATTASEAPATTTTADEPATTTTDAAPEETAEPTTTSTTAATTTTEVVVLVDLQAVMDELDAVHGLRNSECGPGGETNFGNGPDTITECEFGGNSRMFLFATEAEAVAYTELDLNTRRTEQYLRYGPILYLPGTSGLALSSAAERGPTIVAFTEYPAVGHGSDVYRDLAAEINAAAGL